MKLNQFAVYRVDQQTAGKALWHLPYQEARQQNVSITVENYRVISIHEMQEEEKVADIWKRMKKQCEVSDVLVLNRDGEINCYYVDENYPQYLAGFIRINTSGALITMKTENYQIDGKKGNWIATDTIIIDGKQFYLMEHTGIRLKVLSWMPMEKWLSKNVRNSTKKQNKRSIITFNSRHR